MKLNKHIIASALMAIAITASAQPAHKEQHNDINKSIAEDGKTLRIKVSGTINKKAVVFDRTYNIKGLRKMQVDSIKQHVADSLGIN